MNLKYILTINRKGPNFVIFKTMRMRKKMLCILVVLLYFRSIAFKNEFKKKDRKMVDA